jgi:hypothetical protein
MKAADRVALVIDHLDQPPRPYEPFGDIALRPSFARKCQNEGQSERMWPDPVHLMHLPFQAAKNFAGRPRFPPIQTETHSQAKAVRDL